MKCYKCKKEVIIGIKIDLITSHCCEEIQDTQYFCDKCLKKTDFVINIKGFFRNIFEDVKYENKD